MIVITGAELCANMSKYITLSATEQVMVQEENGETVDFRKKYIKEPDEDLARGIPMEDMLELVLQDIREMYKLPR